MRILNKVIVILLLLAGMVLIPLVLIFPEQAESSLRYAADVVKANLDWLKTLAPGAQIGIRLLMAVAGLFVFLIGLLFLILEVFRFRRKTVRLKDQSGEVMLDSISGHLTYHLDMLPDVLRVQPRISSRGKSVRATVYIETPPDVNVPQKSAEVQEVARQVLEEQLGLQTAGDVKIIIRPVDYPKLSAAEQKRPVWAESEAAPPPTSEEPAVEEQEVESLLPRHEEPPQLEEALASPEEPASKVPDQADSQESDGDESVALDAKVPSA